MKIHKNQLELPFTSLLKKITFFGNLGLLFFLFLSFAPAVIRAQSPVTLTGQVLDESNVPIPGVTVQVKNSKTTTVTDKNGNFSISAPSRTAVLEITHVGYETSETTATGGNMSIQLKPSKDNLNEVVVVGYGTQKRISITGAVDKISATAIEGRPVANMTQALQGTSPGLVIQQRTFQPVSGQYNINIRGLGTTNNNDPLIIIDGISGGDLNLVNPSDIESVSVLKDAGSAAIYGSRSANGVLLVTTKKGRKNTKPTVSFSGIYGIQSPHFTIHQVPGWENAMDKNISLENSGKPDQYTQAQIDQFKAQGDGDWKQETLVVDAPQQTYNATVMGGGVNSTYLLSVGYFNQASMLIGPSYGAQRYNVRYSQSTTYDKFTLSTIFSYVKGIYKEPVAGVEGIMGDADRAPLIYSFTDAQGNYLGNPTVGNGNPRAVLEKGGYINSNNDQITGSFTGEYAFNPDFKLRGLFGGTINANTKFSRQVNVNYIGGNINTGKQIYDNNSKSLFTNTQLLAEYHKQLGKSELFVMLGATNESYTYQGNGVAQQGTDSLLGTPTTGTTYVSGNVNNTPGNANDGISHNSIQNTQETSLNSFLGRIQYNYLNKYFVETNFRYDGSSNFSPPERWGFFPSIGVKWRATEEGFLRGYKDKVGDLMPRATYGELGNQSVNPYQYLTSYSTNNNVYGFGNAPVSGAQINLANANLTWEKATSVDLGLDATFFNRRLSFTFDWYRKVTNDILQNREDVPGFYGLGSNTTAFPGLPTYNISKVLSYGWEISLAYDIKGKLFTHRFAANLGDNQNELLALSGGVQEYEFKREEFWFVRRVGLPITTYRGYLTDGLYQSQADIDKSPKIAGNNPGLGDQKYKDVNGDGAITPADRVYLGNPFPRYTFGFMYDVTYKGFDAQIFIQGVGKRDELIRGELLEAYHYGYSGTMFTHQRDFWTPTNTGAKYPRISENGSPSNSNNYKIGSDIYKFNAAYARLKNLQIGYSLPSSVLSKMHFQRCRIYVTAQNLLTISKLKIIDPEQSEFNNRVDVNSGANSARSYPTPIFWGGGLDLTF